MCEKTSLHCILVSNNLIPHEANAINLVFLDLVGNVRMDVDVALIIGLGIIDNNLTVVDITTLVMQRQGHLKSCASFLLFGQALAILFTKVSCICVFDELPLLLTGCFFFYIVFVGSPV